MDKGSLSGLFFEPDNSIFSNTCYSTSCLHGLHDAGISVFYSVMNFLKKSKRHFICEKFTLKNNKKWLINYDNSILWIILIAV